MTTDTDETSGFDAMRAACRLMYETTPLTLAQVAKEVGCGERTIKRWSAADNGWKKLNGRQITERAHQVADRVSAVVADLAPEASAEQRDAALADFREDTAVDERAKLLAAHRRQWRVVEGLLAEAVNRRDDAAARLAERAARTIAIKQRGERLAWGLDSEDGHHTVVIERA